MDCYYYNGELYHHGIAGQKWGVQNGPPYPLNSGVSKSNAKRKFDTGKITSKVKSAAKSAKEKISSKVSQAKEKKESSKQSKKKMDISKMSDDELRQVVNRMDLENRYYAYNSKISAATQSKASKFVHEAGSKALSAAVDVGTQKLKKVLSDALDVDGSKAKKAQQDAADVKKAAEQKKAAKATAKAESKAAKTEAKAAKAEEKAAASANAAKEAFDKRISDFSSQKGTNYTYEYVNGSDAGKKFVKTASSTSFSDAKTYSTAVKRRWTNRK